MDLDANGVTRMGGAVGNEIKDFCGHAAGSEKVFLVVAVKITTDTEAPANSLSGGNNHMPPSFSVPNR